MMLSLLFFLGLQSASATSNPFMEPDESEYFRMENELVTVASRFAQSVSQAPNIVSVISEADIRARNYRKLSDVLRDLPGIYIWKSEEGRELASFRGVISADNNKFLILVDGAPWYDGGYTHAWIDEYMPLHHVQQIEVLKGAGSAIYGTNAFSGVINLVTKKGKDMDGGRVRFSAASYGGFEVAAVGGAQSLIAGQPLDFTMMVRRYDQDGDGIDTNPRGRRNIRGEDPKAATNLSARVSWAGFQAEMHHVDYRHSYLVGEVDDVFDHLAADIDDFGLFYRNTFFRIQYAGNIQNQVTVTPTLWLQRHDNPGAYFFNSLTQNDSGEVESFSSTVVETSKDTVRFGGHVDLEARLFAGHVTVAGFGVERTRVIQFSDVTFNNFSHEGIPSGFGAPSGSGLTNVFGYLQHSWIVIPQLEVVAGMRLDKRLAVGGLNSNEDAFQLALSPRLAVVGSPLPELTTKLMYGRAFRSPNVRETLVDAVFDEEEGEYPFARGSLGVGPERIDTIEAELRWDGAPWLGAGLTGSFSWLDREIDKISPPNEYTNLPGGMNILGLEVALRSRVEFFDAQVSYALTEAKYRKVFANPYSERRQYEFPPHMVKGRVGVRPTNTIGMYVIGEWYSARPRTDWTTNSGLEDGPAVGLLHFSVNLNNLAGVNGLNLTAGVRNLLDHQYSVGVYRDEVDRSRGDDPRYPYGMEMPGRSLNVVLEWTF